MVTMRDVPSRRRGRARRTYGQGSDTRRDQQTCGNHRVFRDLTEYAGFNFFKQTDVLRNTADDHMVDVFDDTVRHKTDRFVFMFRKP